MLLKMIEAKGLKIKNVKISADYFLDHVEYGETFVKVVSLQEDVDKLEVKVLVVEKEFFGVLVLKVFDLLDEFLDGS